MNLQSVAIRVQSIIITALRTWSTSSR